MGSLKGENLYPNINIEFKGKSVIPLLVWVSLNNCFIQLPNKTAVSLLKKDQVKLDVEVNKLRSNLKDKVNDLNDKEGKPELKGFGLKALNKDELAAVKQTLGRPHRSS